MATYSSAPSLSKQSLALLCSLLLRPEPEMEGSPSSGVETAIGEMSREHFDATVELAQSNHVIIRALEVMHRILRDIGDTERLGWADAALAEERGRIANALSHLYAICSAFQESGYDVTVIKSLDHWPDIGSDLDLYTNTAPEKVCRMMRERFQAVIAPRSWGDRLACKWNFEIPGLPEAVEIHMGRLGQTGEQVVLAASLMRRSRVVEIQGRQFRVTHRSDRLMISTLQRMYRHFYFRFCDIVDSADLVESGEVDFNDLQRAATAAGIWEGVATYLQIVSDYVAQYRGRAVALPESVRSAARFGGEQLYFAKSFLRVPIMPQSAGLYSSQLAGLIRNGEYQNSARLGLLPWLATAAVVGMKITGSDKGIW